MKDKLNEINKKASQQASKALSKLIDEHVEIQLSNTRITKVEKLFPAIKQEEIVAGVYLPVTGDVKGASLLILPQKTAFTLSDLLVKRKAGTTRKLTELDQSAIKEAGNIISGNYFAVLSNSLQVKIVEHVPQFSMDMFGAILEQIISKFVQEAEEGVVIQIELIFKITKLKGYFLLLLRAEELKAILGEALEKS
jgi:chemotaxis protein CheC